MSEIWFTADHHFFHKAILKYCKRPFENIDEMNEALIKTWNDRVAPTDTVYYLGDVAFADTKRSMALLYRLNGIVRLVKGNHDKKLRGEILKRFEWVKDYYEFNIDLDKKVPTKICMMHYPMLVWNKCHYGSWHLHGHSHGSLLANNNRTVRRMDVGVDTNKEYRPYFLDEIRTYMESRDFASPDGHGKDDY